MRCPVHPARSNWSGVVYYARSQYQASGVGFIGNHTCTRTYITAAKHATARPPVSVCPVIGTLAVMSGHVRFVHFPDARYNPIRGK
jgi:hypothetical protein